MLLLINRLLLLPLFVGVLSLVLVLYFTAIILMGKSLLLYCNCLPDVL